MKRLNYCLPDYPELSFTTELDSRPERPSRRATIKARGPSEAVSAWWHDVERWCTGKDRTLKGKGTRSAASGPAYMTLTGPDALVSFIVHWLGLDWLEQALQDHQAISRSSSDEIKAMSAQLKNIEDQLGTITRQMAASESRALAVGQALLGRI
ncbi:hypothetical protein [Microvirga sp. M2]|uniref:hypothetical protein n=1 Tax=Microvirga sp. M2 TaxID=3073270 RepID=UPI0039C0975C